MTGIGVPPAGRLGGLEAHHARPLSEGGSNEVGNLQTLCRGCHIEKHKRHDPPRTAWQKLVEAT